jgi:hypothetical protein
MNAGPDLDLLIATKVMDSPKHRWIDGITQRDALGDYEGCGICEIDRYTYQEGGSKALREDELCVQEYSTDLVAAFEVVRKMQDDGFSFKLWQPSRGPGITGDCSVVSFICGRGPCPKHGNPLNNHHGAYDVDAESIELAICKAALIALKVIPAERKE